MPHLPKYSELGSEDDLTELEDAEMLSSSDQLVVSEMCLSVCVCRCQ